MIALWRPYTKKLAADISADRETAWTEIARQKIRAAAANTNTILDKIISHQLIGYIGPMTYVSRRKMVHLGPQGAPMNDR